MSVQLSDFEKIQTLLARYCHVVDHAAPEEISSLFWEDAVLDFNGRFTGPQEITRNYGRWIETMRDPVEGLRHLIYSPYIDIDGQTGTAVCYFDADGVSKKTAAPICIRGVYEDKLRRHNGEWRFAERRIVVY